MKNKYFKNYVEIIYFCIFSIIKYLIKKFCFNNKNIRILLNFRKIFIYYN